MSTSSWALTKPGGTLTFYGDKAIGTPSVLRNGWMEPAMRPRIGYLPDEGDVMGSEPISSAWGESLLGLRFRLAADSEGAFQVKYDEIVETIGQLSYTLTRTIGGAVRAYECRTGSMELVNRERKWFDAGLVVDYYAFTAPCYPLPVVTP